ncbi:hypothetical protein PR048_028722 [Dryococelus australis]|uniref:PiggyBac transposable element-derived protein domain-containing protein n=1 Tax=Dryococelus australis TaxID=614101 RepID=A0ABQ9GE16_9NEOP|nr:hypothetical protein PR048_028722 [Dryococelus australis]
MDESTSSLRNDDRHIYTWREHRSTPSSFITAEDYFRGWRHFGFGRLTCDPPYFKSWLCKCQTVNALFFSGVQRVRVSYLSMIKPNQIKLHCETSGQLAPSLLFLTDVSVKLRVRMAVEHRLKLAVKRRSKLPLNNVHQAKKGNVVAIRTTITRAADVPSLLRARRSTGVQCFRCAACTYGTLSVTPNGSRSTGPSSRRRVVLVTSYWLLQLGSPNFPAEPTTMFATFIASRVVRAGNACLTDTPVVVTRNPRAVACVYFYAVVLCVNSRDYDTETFGYVQNQRGNGSKSNEWLKTRFYPDRNVSHYHCLINFAVSHGCSEARGGQNPKGVTAEQKLIGWSTNSQTEFYQQFRTNKLCKCQLQADRQALCRVPASISLSVAGLISRVTGPKHYHVSVNSKVNSRIFASGNRAGRRRWSTGFLGDLPFPRLFHSGAAIYSPRFIPNRLSRPRFECTLTNIHTMYYLYMQPSPRADTADFTGSVFSVTPVIVPILQTIIDGAWQPLLRVSGSDKILVCQFGRKPQVQSCSYAACIIHQQLLFSFLVGEYNKEESRNKTQNPLNEFKSAKGEKNKRQNFLHKFVCKAHLARNEEIEQVLFFSCKVMQVAIVLVLVCWSCDLLCWKSTPAIFSGLRSNGGTTKGTAHNLHCPISAALCPFTGRWRGFMWFAIFTTNFSNHGPWKLLSLAETLDYFDNIPDDDELITGPGSADATIFPPDDGASDDDSGDESCNNPDVLPPKQLCAMAEIHTADDNETGDSQCSQMPTSQMRNLQQKGEETIIRAILCLLKKFMFSFASFTSVDMPFFHEKLFWETADDVRNILVANAMRRNRFEETTKFLQFATMRNWIAEIRWVMAQSSGYCLAADFYQGKNPNGTRPGDQGLGEPVVLTFCDSLITSFPGIKFSFYFDNFFTNTKLICSLSDKGMKGTGTAKINRMGKCPIAEKKVMQKRERISYEVYTEVNKGISAVAWRYNNVVYTLSNEHGVQRVQYANRYSSKENKSLQVTQPNVIQMLARSKELTVDQLSFRQQSVKALLGKCGQVALCPGPMRYCDRASKPVRTSNGGHITSTGNSRRTCAHRRRNKTPARRRGNQFINEAGKRRRILRASSLRDPDLWPENARHTRYLPGGGRKPFEAVSQFAERVLSRSLLTSQRVLYAVPTPRRERHRESERRCTLGAHSRTLSGHVVF